MDFEFFRVQNHLFAEDVEKLAFGVVVRRKPLGGQALREFKNLDRQIGQIAVIVVGGFQLQADGGLTFVQFGPLGGVFVGADLAVHAELDQGLELGLHLPVLPLEFGAVLDVGVLTRVCSGSKDLHEPAANLRVVDPHGVEAGAELPIDFGLREPHLGVIRQGVHRAAVVAVVADGAVGGGLELLLAGDDAAAVPAGDELAGEGDLGFGGDSPVQALGHGLEGRQVHQRRELAGMPCALELHIADVVPVVEHAVKRGPVEARLAVRVDDALPGQRVRQRFERVLVVREELKDAADLGGVDRIGFDGAPPVDANAAVAEVSAQGQSVLNPAAEATLDIRRLLIGLVRGEYSTHPALHPPGGCLAGGLVGEEQRNAGAFGEFLQIGPVTDVAGGAVDLDEQHAVERGGVLLDVRGEVAKRRSLLTLGGGLGELVEFGDRAAQS